MTNPLIHIFPTTEELAISFTERLKEHIEKITEKGGNIHICLSGGNTPKTVFKILADEYYDTIPWKQVHFYWGDERCVPAGDMESNYGEAKRILFDNINLPKENIHPVNGENNAEEEAISYSQVLLNNIPIENGIPVFDVMILGMGDDGHTASVFPDNIKLLHEKKICTVSVHPLTGQKRITLTGTILNNAIYTYFLITGKNKAKVLKDILEGKPEAVKYPTYYIKPVKGGLNYFLDQNAASEIN